MSNNTRKAILTASIKYSESPLIYPQKDVELISKTLIKRCQFNKSDITSLIHNSESNDEDYINTLKETCFQFEKTRKNQYDLILFYYSGHGIYKENEGTSYLQISDEKLIQIDEIISIISSVNAKNKYFIIDACQSGGFSLMRPKGKIQRQYSYNSKGIYCMFGTTKDLLAFEPTIRDVIKRKISNSFYTHFIAEALNNRGNYIDDTISIRTIDDYATKKTPTYTNFEQIPFSTTEITGYFPFGIWEDENELDDISKWETNKHTNLQHLHSNEIEVVEYLFNSIQNYFTEDNPYISNYEKESLTNLSQPAIDILNDKLDLIHKKYKDEPLLNGLISHSEKQKYQFLIFILEQSKLNIDLHSKDSNGNTVLINAINNEKYLAQYIIALLFIRKYTLTDEENQYLYQAFENKSTKPEILENVTCALVFLQLKEKSLIEKGQKMIRLIFTLLSFKYNKIIGYKLNFTALANNYLQNYQQFSRIFIECLKEYKHFDTLIAKDSFRNKFNKIQDEIPYQESEYDDVLKILFPELFK